MESTICALNADLVESNKMLADNQPLVSLGAQLTKLKSINKLPPSLDADIFYAMAQAVMPKSSPGAISLEGELVVAGLLASLDINDNKIISGISNCIPSTSNLRYVVNKSCGDTFMRIAGFVCNYPCSMSCNKGKRTGLGRLVKEIDLWDGEQVQSIRLDADASKGRS